MGMKRLPSRLEGKGRSGRGTCKSAAPQRGVPSQAALEGAKRPPPLEGLRQSKKARCLKERAAMMNAVKGSGSQPPLLQEAPPPPTTHHNLLQHAAQQPAAGGFLEALLQDNTE